MNKIRIAVACPTCHANLDGFTFDPGEGATIPKPGDIVTCCYCTGFMRLGPDLEASALTSGQVAVLSPDGQQTLLNHRSLAQRVVDMQAGDR